MTNETTSVLPVKYRNSMLRSMRSLFRIMVDLPLELYDMSPKEGIGKSLVEKNKAGIWLSTATPFHDLSDEEKELALYGVGTHEVLHILRTDFAYASKKLKGYSPGEREPRHTFFNIVEDASIEYLRSDNISDFLNEALTFAIGYFYKHGEELGKQSHPYLELITALILFGDVGVLKGKFAFPESKHAFLECIRLYERAITEPVSAVRFDLSQQMFEECRWLWDDFCEKEIRTRSLVAEILKSLGKGKTDLSSGNGSAPQENGTPASEKSSSKADDRRKKTLHLIDEEQAKEMKTEPGSADVEDATDIYAVVNDSEDQDLKGVLSDQDINIVDERKKKDTPEAGAPSEAGDKNSSQKASNEGESEDVASLPNASSDESSDVPSRIENGNQTGEFSKENGQITDREVKDNDGLAEEPSDSPVTELDDQAVSVNSNNTSDHRVDKKDLGQELDALHKELSEELSEELSVSSSLVEEIRETMQNDLARENTQSIAKRKAMKAEAIDVTVESPYYKDVKYENIDVTVMNNSVYDTIRTEEIKRLTLNLKSAFKKVFCFKSGRKEYRTNGRISTERLCGKKLTARVFYRNTKPEDKTDMAIVIFVDQSGSMRNGMNRVKQTLVILLDALRDFDVKVKVVGFTTNRSVTYYHYGNRKWNNDRNLVRCAMNMNASGGTFLGHALRYTGTMLKNRPERNKIYICITDGDPQYNVYKNYSQGMNDCRQAINEVRKFADVIGIGLYGSEREKEAFKYIFRDTCVSMSSLDGLTKELPGRIKKILRT